MVGVTRIEIKHEFVDKKENNCEKTKRIEQNEKNSNSHLEKAWNFVKKAMKNYRTNRNVESKEFWLVQKRVYQHSWITFLWLAQKMKTYQHVADSLFQVVSTEDEDVPTTRSNHFEIWLVQKNWYCTDRLSNHFRMISTEGLFVEREEQN